MIHSLFYCNSIFHVFRNVIIKKSFYVLGKLIIIILMDARKMYIENTHVHRTKFFKSSYIRYAIDEKS